MMHGIMSLKHIITVIRMPNLAWILSDTQLETTRAATEGCCSNPGTYNKIFSFPHSEDPHLRPTQPPAQDHIPSYSLGSIFYQCIYGFIPV